MPPLIMFGRKWNIATDDFVYLSFWEFLIRLFIIVAYVYFNFHENMINNCNSKLYQICHFLLSGSLTCNLIIILAIMIMSAQGLIMEESKRSKIPFCIYIKLFMSFYEAILSIVAFAINYRYSLIPNKFCEQILIPNKIILYCIGPFLTAYLIIFCITYDQLGRHGSDVILLATKKTNIWKHRLKWILCIKKVNDEERNALDSAANIFASLCEESNLVFSDFEAGIQLLCKQDANAYDFTEYSLKINKSKSGVTNSSSFNQKMYTIINHFINNEENYVNISNFKKLANENLIETDSKVNNSEVNLADKISTGNKSDLKSDWRDIRFIYYFSTMAKASYGWPIHLLFHDENKSRLKFCMGLCCKHSTSCFCNKCICCDCEKSNSNDQKLIYVKERFCSCHEKAILNETHLEKENLVCVSFYNKTFHSPFFIAISHEIEVIILSIRGTFSLKDILTDMDANLIEVFEDGFSGYLAHSGMLNAAKNIKRKIQEENIIHNILNDNKNYRLIITGHSLGAGIAIILSCFYYHEFPNLKCYAFSPPLGTVNIKTADYCKDFVLSIVNGVEWVPRISLQSIVVAKRRLIECLENYPHSKFQLLIKKFIKCKCCYCSKTSCRWNILNSFERDEKYWENIEINTKLPGQIIHITNIKKLNDPNKSDLINSNRSFYTPIITSSDQFKTVVFHPKMFKDHFPHQMVKRLFNILYENQLFYPNCHHYSKHYWPSCKDKDIMKLPFISGILNSDTTSLSYFATNICNRKKSKILEDSNNSLYLISKITVV